MFPHSRALSLLPIAEWGAISAVSRSRHSLTALLATASVLSFGGGLARGAPVKPSSQPAAPMQLSNDELLSRMQCMEQRIRVLEAQLNSQPPPPNPRTDSGPDNPCPKTTEPPRP